MPLLVKNKRGPFPRKLKFVAALGAALLAFSGGPSNTANAETYECYVMSNDAGGVRRVIFTRTAPGKSGYLPGSRKKIEFDSDGLKYVGNENSKYISVAYIAATGELLPIFTAVIDKKAKKIRTSANLLGISVPPPVWEGTCSVY